MGNKSLRKKTKAHYVYILRGRGGVLYTGYTVDLERRIRLHNSGKGSKYLRAHLPAILVYVKKYRYHGEALRAEYRIKQLTHKQKAALVKRSAKIGNTPKNP